MPERNGRASARRSLGTSAGDRLVGPRILEGPPSRGPFVREALGLLDRVATAGPADQEDQEAAADQPDRGQQHRPGAVAGERQDVLAGGGAGRPGHGARRSRGSGGWRWRRGLAVGRQPDLLAVPLLGVLAL